MSEDAAGVGKPRWKAILRGCGSCLLAVIVFFVIATAVVSYIFPRARENGKRSSCMSNMKTLAVAMQMYAQDYHGCLPSTPAGEIDAVFENSLGAAMERGDTRLWTRAFSEYIKDDWASACPSDKAFPKELSYCYKHAVNKAAQARMKLEQFSYPQRQVLLYERRSFHYGEGPIEEECSILVSFADGRTQAVKMKDVGRDAEPRYFNSVGRTAKQSAQSKPYWDPRYCYDDLPLSERGVKPSASVYDDD